MKKAIDEAREALSIDMPNGPWPFTQEEARVAIMRALDDMYGTAYTESGPVLYAIYDEDLQGIVYAFESWKHQWESASGSEPEVPPALEVTKIGTPVATFHQVMQLPDEWMFETRENHPIHPPVVRKVAPSPRDWIASELKRTNPIDD